MLRKHNFEINRITKLSNNISIIKSKEIIGTMELNSRSPTYISGYNILEDNSKLIIINPFLFIDILLIQKLKYCKTGLLIIL